MRISHLAVFFAVLQVTIAFFGPPPPPTTPYPTAAPVRPCDPRVTSVDDSVLGDSLDESCPGWDNETTTTGGSPANVFYHIRHAFVTWDGATRTGGHCGKNANLDEALQLSIANGLFGGSDDVPDNVNADGEIIYINDLPQQDKLESIGADGSDYYTQAFIASHTIITEFRVWLQSVAGNPGNAGIRLSIANDDGNGRADVTSLVYEGPVVFSPNSGGWVYESGLSLSVTVGERYHVVLDGYQNPGATGASRCGTTNDIYPNYLGEGLHFSNNGGVSWIEWSGEAMSIQITPGTVTRDCSAYCILNSEGKGYFKFDAQKKCFRYRRQGKMCGNDAERKFADRLKSYLC